jgi:hypothetical protein
LASAGGEAAKAPSAGFDSIVTMFAILAFSSPVPHFSGGPRP